MHFFINATETWLYFTLLASLQKTENHIFFAFNFSMTNVNVKKVEMERKINKQFKERIHVEKTANGPNLNLQCQSAQPIWVARTSWRWKFAIPNKERFCGECSMRAKSDMRNSEWVGVIPICCCRFVGSSSMAFTAKACFNIFPSINLYCAQFSLATRVTVLGEFLVYHGDEAIVASSKQIEPPNGHSVFEFVLYPSGCHMEKYGCFLMLLFLKLFKFFSSSNQILHHSNWPYQGQKSVARRSCNVVTAANVLS